MKFSDNLQSKIDKHNAWKNSSTEERVVKEHLDLLVCSLMNQASRGVEICDMEFVTKTFFSNPLVLKLWYENDPNTECSDESLGIIEEMIKMALQEMGLEHHSETRSGTTIMKFKKMK